MLFIIAHLQNLSADLEMQYMPERQMDFPIQNPYEPLDVDEEYTDNCTDIYSHCSSTITSPSDCYNYSEHDATIAYIEKWADKHAAFEEEIIDKIYGDDHYTNCNSLSQSPGTTRGFIYHPFQGDERWRRIGVRDYSMERVMRRRYSDLVRQNIDLEREQRKRSWELTSRLRRVFGLTPAILSFKWILRFGKRSLKNLCYRLGWCWRLGWFCWEVSIHFTSELGILLHNWYVYDCQKPYCKIRILTSVLQE